MNKLVAAIALVLLASQAARGQSFLDSRQVMVKGVGLNSWLFSPIIINNQSILPATNPLPTMAGVVTTATTTNPNTREFVYADQFNVNTGASATGDARDKVWRFIGLSMQPGGARGWGINIQANIEAGAINAAGTTGFDAMYPIEIDMENKSGFDIPDLAAPAGYGLSFGTGAVHQKVGTAVIVNSINPAYKNFWRAFHCQGGVEEACFSDNGTSVYSLEIGGAHVGGITLQNGAFAGDAIYFPNNSGISAYNAARTSFIHLLRLDPSNNIVVGDGSEAGVSVRNSLTVQQTLYGSTTADSGGYGVSVENRSTAGTSAKGAAVQFVNEDTTGVRKPVATFTATLADGNAVNSGVAVQVRNNNGLIPAGAFNSDGTWSPVTRTSDPSSCIDGSEWYRTDLHAKRICINGTPKTVAVG